MRPRERLTAKALWESWRSRSDHKRIGNHFHDYGRQHYLDSNKLNRYDHDNPLVAGVTEVKAAHITELRTAINDVRSHLSLGAYSWAYSATTSDYISANPIIEMRTALDEALGAPSPAYAAGLAQNQPILKVHIQELRDRILAAWSTDGSAIDIRWLVTDHLGTPRMIINKSGTLSGVSRHD